MNGFEHDGIFITDPTMDESGRFEVYGHFCKKENIPCVDAQEYLFDPSKLTDKQHDWIKAFSKAWEGLSA